MAVLEGSDSEGTKVSHQLACWLLAVRLFCGPKSGSHRERLFLTTKARVMNLRSPDMKNPPSCN